MTYERYQKVWWHLVCGKNRDIAFVPHSEQSFRDSMEDAWRLTGNQLEGYEIKVKLHT